MRRVARGLLFCSLHGSVDVRFCCLSREACHLRRVPSCQGSLPSPLFRASCSIISCFPFQFSSLRPQYSEIDVCTSIHLGRTIWVPSLSFASVHSPSVSTSALPRRLSFASRSHIFCSTARDFSSASCFVQRLALPPSTSAILSSRSCTRRRNLRSSSSLVWK